MKKEKSKKSENRLSYDSDKGLKIVSKGHNVSNEDKK